MMVGHAFGGPWTEIKLDAVEYYLNCYSPALKAVGFDLWYLDAFAGTGDREAQTEVGGLWENRPIETVRETLAGSAIRALSIKPGFDHFVFIEKDGSRCQALEELKTLNPSRDIRVVNGDANEVLKEFSSRHPWSQPSTCRSRGVVFLDPYALHVDWTTLKSLAKTRSLDVWYLFPIRDTIRQLARNFSGIGPKAPMLDRVLGPEWRELYKLPPEPGPVQKSWLDDDTSVDAQRTVSSEQFEQWLKARLEVEFSYVSVVPILNSPNRQIFSLFLCVSNPSKPAIDLAKQFMRYVKKNFSPKASHRRFGR